MVSKEILSPAKINLMLRILGQRSDGYHLLQTCFQLLDWGDLLTFNKITADGNNDIRISGFEGLNVENNLIQQAAKVLKPLAQNKSDWLVEVEKQIPLGAGLGGGSSNAATTLKFLNDAWQCQLSEEKLLELASNLGADVPVFIKGESALAEGIGDQLTPIKFNTPYILLLFPECHISTAELFRSPHLFRQQSPIKPEYLQNKSFWINDFMPEVLNKFPLVEKLYKRINLKMDVRLSGSGSTLFVVFNDYLKAQQSYDFASKICKAHLVQSWDKAA